MSHSVRLPVVCAMHRACACTAQYLLWFEAGLRLFPDARYFGSGDDDVYLSPGRLEADLLSVAQAQRSPDELVLYGLLMWKAYYDTASMSTSTGFSGWEWHDWTAVAQRKGMLLCRAWAHWARDSRCRREHKNATRAACASQPLLESADDLGAFIRAIPVCKALRRDHAKAALMGTFDAALPPWPYIHGPLFAVSRALAAALINASDPFAATWLHRFGRTAAVRHSQQYPHGVWGVSCWPVVDSIMGFWLTQVALRLGRPLMLVNSPFMKQHLAWPSNASFGARAIVMHGMRSARQDAFRTHARSVSATLPFQPAERHCDRCSAMGWSTWPASPMGEWRCCGIDLRSKGGQPRNKWRRLKPCNGKRCPANTPMEVLRQLERASLACLAAEATDPSTCVNATLPPPA